VSRGRTGEGTAATYLAGKGYAILGANQRTPVGELDLVCRRGRLIVVVEVKARGSEEYGSALEAIGPRKARRMRAAALWWLADKGLLPCQTRFDAVLVMLDASGAPRTLQHVEDIMGPGS
jgi:putative endonuclease